MGEKFGIWCVVHVYFFFALGVYFRTCLSFQLQDASVFARDVSGKGFLAIRSWEL